MNELTVRVESHDDRTTFRNHAHARQTAENLAHELIKLNTVARRAKTLAITVDFGHARVAARVPVPASMATTPPNFTYLAPR